MNNLCYCHSITFKTNFQLNQNINKGSFLTFDRSNKHKCHFLLSKKKNSHRSNNITFVHQKMNLNGFSMK